MREALPFLAWSVAIGIGATAFMDLAASLRRRLFGTPSADYGLVGRWLAHVAQGRFLHDAIKASPPVRGERGIGWSAHYLIGIAFAALLLSFYGLEWVRHPTLGPALLVGLGSVTAPFMIMQPGMGAGIAASRTPRPTAARLRSLTTHAIFGVGLYVTASLVQLGERL
jgi:hypothetical protein